MWPTAQKVVYKACFSASGCLQRRDGLLPIIISSCQGKGQLNQQQFPWQHTGIWQSSVILHTSNPSTWTVEAELQVQGLPELHSKTWSQNRLRKPRSEEPTQCLHRVVPGTDEALCAAFLETHGKQELRFSGTLDFPSDSTCEAISTQVAAYLFLKEMAHRQYGEQPQKLCRQ